MNYTTKQWQKLLNFFKGFHFHLEILLFNSFEQDINFCVLASEYVKDPHYGNVERKNFFYVHNKKISSKQQKP